MAWYWIVLIIFGYLFIGSVVIGLMERAEFNAPTEANVLVFIFWPIAIIIFFFIFVSVFVSKIPKREDIKKKKEETKANNNKKSIDI